jgi:hypothetical protein
VQCSQELKKEKERKVTRVLALEDFSAIQEEGFNLSLLET